MCNLNRDYAELNNCVVVLIVYELTMCVSEIVNLLGPKGLFAFCLKIKLIGFK